MTPRWRRVAALAAVALTLPLGGCATGYVLRGAYEEARLLWRREPIDRMLQRDDVEGCCQLRRNLRRRHALKVECASPSAR